MLAGFRSFAKSPFAVILFGLLIVSFAVFGISDVFRHQPGKWVIAAGSRDMSPDDFKARFELIRKRAESQGQILTPDVAMAQGIDRRMLSDIASQQSLSELLHKMGVRPSEKLISDTLREQLMSLPPQMRPYNPITGKFDEEAYKRLLAEQGMTVDGYNVELGDTLASNQLSAAIGIGLRAPRTYSALDAAFALEARDLAAFPILQDTVAKPTPPTEAQLRAFMKEHAADLTVPETRILSVARFSAQALAPSVTVAEADVVKTFNFRKDTLGTAETRSFVQIVAPDAKAAAVIAQRLAKGDQPAIVASAYGKQPVMVEAKPKSALPDRKVADAVFAMTAGQISGPIAGELGVSVVKLTKITPATTPTLESVRPAIEAELKAQAAENKAFEQTDTYQNAHDGGDNLVTAATKANALVLTTAPIAANGADRTGQPVPGLTPDVLKTAFELPAGGESEVITVSKGEYFAVRVEKVIPSAMRPLEEVRGPLTQRWMIDRMLESMKVKAEALAARIKKGESIEAVAASAGAKVQRIPNMSRQNGRQYQALGRDLLLGAFGAKPGEPFAAQGPQGGFLVAVVEKVHPAPTQQLAQMTEAMRGQTSQSLLNDVGQAAREAAKAQLKTKTNLDLARQAIGIDTSALPKDGEPGGKAKVTKEKAQ